MILEFARAPLARAIVAWHVLWGLPALFVPAPTLIIVLNCLVFAIACGVITAYLPSVYRACTTERPNQGDILVVGIWLAWISLIEARVWSIAWRALNRPEWLVDTDITTHIIAMALLAGVMHLAGPEAIEGRVPTKQWIRIGVLVASGALVAIVMLVAFGDTGALLTRR